MLRFNTTDQSFNYYKDSQTVTLKGIFYNYWYLVKSLDKQYIEIYIDSTLKKTILLPKDKTIELRSTESFLKKYICELVIKNKNADKLYSHPINNSDYETDTLSNRYFYASKVKDDWLKISCGGETLEGWIKWIDDSGVLIKGLF